MQNHSLEIIDDSIPSFDRPLLFNNDVDTSNVKNLLLIDSIVAESQLFFDSSNQNTFPIIYSNNSNREDFIQLLENKFSNGLERIAFVFHDNIKDGKVFLNQELFFSEDFNSYSPNTQILIDVIKKFGVKNIDFLACNSLNYPNWVNFYELLRKETNVIVGASNDNTGNLKNGGNWIMENTNENVLNTYFNSNIDSYASTLAVTVLSISTVLTQALVNSYTWPVTVNGGTVGNPVIISFSENITLNSVSQYFNIGSSYITFDGTGKTITISSVTNYLGLINNGTSSAIGYSNITVKNINNAISGSSTLATSAGWICQSYFGKGATNILVDNCTNSGTISGNGSGIGGICGEFVADNGTIIISNCLNSGLISTNARGGICARNLGQNGGNVTILNCSNSGIISFNFAGGICGNNAGRNNGNVSITNCYNSGVISGRNSGGISGSSTGYNNGTVSITNCYNSGVISGQSNGGISGNFFGSNSNNLCSIINCYNTGAINGNDSGGIIGSSVGYNDSATYTPKILIQNCYSLGNIGITNGGICGGTDGYPVYANIPIINITNCYTSYDSIGDPNSQYISINLESYIRNVIILTNVYSSLISSWSDTSANSSLTGTPSSLYSINPGTSWFLVATNTPYLISSYNASLYSPSTVSNTSTGNYTSSAGLFTPDYNYNLVSVNNAVPPTNITINNTSGVLTFTNVLTNTYVQKVLSYKGVAPKYNAYNFNTFTLNQTSPIPAITITQNGGTIYIRQSGSNIQYQSNSTGGAWTNVSGWPVTIVNSNPVAGNILTISLTTNISISDTTVVTGTNGYFICGSSYITYDGTGKTVTIDSVTNYLGLIQNGSLSTDGYHAITVKNINSAATNSFLISVSGRRGGWICGPYFGINIKNISGYVAITVDNCSNSGVISGTSTGGICGISFCSNGVGNITNCRNSGVISGISAGGICGRSAGLINGTVSISNCTNTGVISGGSAGGICGDSAGFNNGTLSISNCYNTGTISSQNSGGICGFQTGTNNGIVSISNCINSGAISGLWAGGICGSDTGRNNGTVSISICSNSGIISGIGAGGIIGRFFGIYSNNQCSIINCYNTGAINGNNAGGITGADIGYNDVVYTPKILIQNCYSLGNIGTTAGGICGGTTGFVYTTNIPIINITNCYTSYNSITDIGSQYIATSLPIKSSIILTNVYSSLTNSWSDTNASSALSGALNIYRNSKLYKYYSNFGEVWYSNQNNTPFSFTSNLDNVPRRQIRD